MTFFLNLVQSTAQLYKNGESYILNLKLRIKLTVVANRCSAVRTAPVLPLSLVVKVCHCTVFIVAIGLSVSPVLQCGQAPISQSPRSSVKTEPDVFSKDFGIHHVQVLCLVSDAGQIGEMSSAVGLSVRPRHGRVDVVKCGTCS